MKLILYYLFNACSNFTGKSKVHIGNIPLELQEQYIEEYFEKTYGSVSESQFHLKHNPVNRFGFITFIHASSATKALEDPHFEVKISTSDGVKGSFKKYIVRAKVGTLTLNDVKFIARSFEYVEKVELCDTTGFIKTTFGSPDQWDTIRRLNNSWINGGSVKIRKFYSIEI